MVEDGVGVAVGAELRVTGVELPGHAVLGELGGAGEDVVYFAVALVGVLADGGYTYIYSVASISARFPSSSAEKR